MVNIQIPTKQLDVLCWTWMFAGHTCFLLYSGFIWSTSFELWLKYSYWASWHIWYTGNLWNFDSRFQFSAMSIPGGLDVLFLYVRLKKDFHCQIWHIQLEFILEFFSFSFNKFDSCSLPTIFFGRSSEDLLFFSFFGLGWWYPVTPYIAAIYLGKQ